MKRRRVAIVTPWYGEESKGGAELQAAELATRLSQFDDVTMLTTTSRSFHHDWGSDYHKPGLTSEAGFKVNRFRVRPRDGELFVRLNEELLGTRPEQWREISGKRTRFDPFIDESINAPELETHLAREAQKQYDAVLFLPYLYGVVVRGIEHYPGKAFLIPCLHDEAYARIPRIEDIFHDAGRLLFNSAGEAELALRLYGPGILAKSVVIGEGIDDAAGADGVLAVEKPFYVYIGRREPEKGVDSLVDIFRRHHTNGGEGGPSLVLIGPGERSYHDPQLGIIDLGFVDDVTKTTLLKNAVALLNPSRNESYSRVLMEAWRLGVPVVAHGRCLATASAVRESRAGFVADSEAEWFSALRQLEAMNEGERHAIGALGLDYATEHADWDKAIERLRSAMGFDAPAVRRTGTRIDQVLEGFDDGDAISDYARSISERLRVQGYESNIYALNLPAGLGDAQRLEPRSLAGADAVIYHHSIGSAGAEAVLAADCPKALVYHNITPARFFEPYAPAVAEQLDHGRRQLRELVRGFDVFVADSDYNGLELKELGAQRVRTIPVVTNLNRLDRTPGMRASNLFGGTTWLFVGRVSPNKGLRQLIEAFEAHLALNDDANLVILGKYDRGDRYYSELKTLVLQRRLDPYVTFTGFVDEPTIVARYRTADVFVCLSEHEGFCVPLVEAMFFDVPIVAKAMTAVPGTLDGAGLVLEPEADAYDIAAAVHEVCTNDALRTKIIEGQRKRRRAFLPEQITPLIDSLAADLIAARV